MSRSGALDGRPALGYLPLLSVYPLHQLLTYRAARNRTRQPDSGRRGAAQRSERAPVPFRANPRALLPACAPGRPGGRASPRSRLPGAAGAAHLTTRGRQAAPRGLPYLSPRTKGFLSRAESACPGHPGPGLHRSSAPVPVFLRVAFNFLIGEPGRLQKVLSRHAEPDSPPPPPSSPRNPEGNQQKMTQDFLRALLCHRNYGQKLCRPGQKKNNKLTN